MVASLEKKMRKWVCPRWGQGGPSPTAEGATCGHLLTTHPTKQHKAQPVVHDQQRTGVAIRGDQGFIYVEIPRGSLIGACVLPQGHPPQ